MTKIWAGFQLDYDKIAGTDDCRELFFVSRRTREICIALLQYAEWPTRYHSELGAPISKDVVDAWASSALAELMSPGSLTDGEMCMSSDICVLVAACLDEGNLTETLQAWQEGQGQDAGTGVGNQASPYATQDLVSECDPDLLFGAVTQLVDLFHTIILDFLQGLVAATQWASKLAYFVDSIPVVGLLPFDEMMAFAGDFFEYIIESYAASYDETLRTTYRCEIFCLALENCTFTLQDFGGYFLDKFERDFKELDWEDFVEFMLQGTFAGTEFVHLMHAILCYSLANGSRTLGMTPAMFSTIVRSLFNDPNSDWTVLCPECSDEVWEENITALLTLRPDPAPQGSELVASWNGTSWDGGDGLWIPSPAYYIRSVSLGIEFPRAKITRIRVTDYTLLAHDNDDSYIYANGPWAGNPLLWHKDATGYHISHTTGDIDEFMTEIGWLGICDGDSDINDLTGAVGLYTFEVRGRGFNPFA